MSETLPARLADALADTAQRHDRVAARFAETHGLALSRQVALLAACFSGLEGDAARALASLGLAPAGPTRWFTDAGWARRVAPGLDPRLDFRFRRDPPELVTVATGAADGHHLGFVHDLPDEPPWLLAESFARDTAETAAVCGKGRTIVDFLRQRAKAGVRDGLPTAPLLPVLDAMGDAAAAVRTAEKRAHRPGTVTRLPTLGGVGPLVPPKTVLPALPDRSLRRAALLGGEPVVDAWLAQARADCAAGAPALALLLGHDLWFLDLRRDDAVELLVAGYAAWDRGALGAIAAVHHAHRDRASVEVHA